MSKSRSLSAFLAVGLLAATASLARAQEPPPDGDRDGTPDAEDACPDTPAGMEAIRFGCAALEVLQGPEAVLRPLGLALDELAPRARTTPTAPWRRPAAASAASRGRTPTASGW
jgi:hypothetical protein